MSTGYAKFELTREGHKVLSYNLYKIIFINPEAGASLGYKDIVSKPGHITVVGTGLNLRLTALHAADCTGTGCIIELDSLVKDDSVLIAELSMHEHIIEKSIDMFLVPNVTNIEELIEHNSKIYGEKS